MAAVGDKGGSKNKTMDKLADKDDNSVTKKDELASGNTKKRGRAPKKAPAAKTAEEEKPVAEKDTDEEAEEEKPPSKKAKMAKASTMAVTAKEGTELLGDEKLGDTRSGTKQKAKKTSATKRVKSVDAVVEEAKAAFGSLDTSEGRTLRKRPPASSPAKTSLKKAGTMQKTAKEGKEFLKRGRAKKTA